jgi:outer membrane protein assembly factor BamB
LPGDRVLVAEYQGGRVSEWSHKGELLWEKKVGSPLVAQRLPGGRTFIATSSGFSEVDRTGKELWTLPAPQGGQVMKAYRMRNGHVACVARLGVSRFYELDREGKVLRSFGVSLTTSGGRLDVLPNGHVLIPEKDNHRVVEYDVQGREAWHARFEQPIAAVRLPNGQTLVTSYQSQRAVALDAKGGEAWEYKTDKRVTRAWRH